MRFCNTYGIPHSKFLEEWSDEDRSKALGYLIYEAKMCSMCGTSAWEWDSEQGGSPFAYEPVEEICPGCERKDWMRKDTDTKPGRHIVLRKTEDIHGH